MSTSSPYVLGPNASISEVLDGITRAHRLDRDAVPELVEKFNQHMVIKMSHLMRLQPQQLQRLNLPLLIEAELHRVLTHESDAVIKYSPVVSPDPSFESSSLSESQTSEEYARSRRSTLSPRDREEMWTVPEEQKEAVRASWKKITDGGNERTVQFFDEFYATLFAISPSAKSLFEDKGMPTQVRALITMMNSLIKGLDNLDRLTAMFKKLGAHHMFYGVEVKDYQAFGVVLVETFKKVLGSDEITIPLQEAWYALFGKVASIMVQGVEEAKRGIKCQVLHRSGKNWKKRIFVLQSGKLSFYRPVKSDKGVFEKPVEAIDLTKVVTFESNEEELPGIGHPLSIKLEETNAKGDCMFAALNEEEFRLITSEIDWRLKALQKKLKYHPDFAK
jgi:hemoglobin-like flavoprotein